MSRILQVNVKNLTGVGEQRAKMLEKTGITDLRSLLYRFPRSYEYRGNVKPLAAAVDGEKASFILTVASRPLTARAKNSILLTKFMAVDGTEKCSVVYFNNKFIANSLAVGESYRFYGKISRHGRQTELICPVAERINGENGAQSLHPLYPVYSAWDGMSSQQLGRIISQGLTYLERFGADIENLPAETVEKYGFVSRLTALKNIHFPSDFKALNEAKRRLAYEEIYAFALRAIQKKNEYGSCNAPTVPACDMTEFKQALPYELTNAQKRTVNELYRDMTNKKRIPMRRIICGDVGSGKTVCAAAAVYISAKAGLQSAFMAPTEILARQHYKELSEFFSSMGISCALLLGDTPRGERARIYEDVTSGKTDVLIGTVALITDKVVFSKLGLVICDEQHRFGVNQRDALVNKGVGAHMLVMSATPIPRTLALVMFGDLDVSLIDELPAGRQKVDTFAVSKELRPRIQNFIRKQVQEGRQAYVVCPSVEEADEGEVPIEALSDKHAATQYLSDRNSRMAAVAYAEELAQNVFPEFRVAYLHGKMKSAEKDKVMSEFAAGNTDILVSTTVVEVGINVPNATVMVVENAECFGLSQLHQLRGRVGRGKHKSYCILVSSSESESAMNRLRVMKDCSDGYKIAEQDLKQRGPGDFIKNSSGQVRQHGEFKMSFGGLLDDTSLLYAAFADAEKYSQVK